MPQDIPKECLDSTTATPLSCIPFLFQRVVNWLLIFAGIVAVIIVIVSGIKFMTSGGDPKQVEGARKTLTYAIIGLVIILLSFFIINMIAYFTGVTCINMFGFDVCEKNFHN